MLEKIGNEDIIVRNYTENAAIKEYIQDELMPKAFPDIDLTKANLGFHGLVSEYLSQAIEDSTGTASLMLNEAFITRALLPSSIYANAAIFEIGYSFATPSRCNFALQLNLDDVINNSRPVENTSIMRYMLDRDTGIILGDNVYRLDYDICIDSTYIDGKRVFNVYYDTSSQNTISNISNKYIRHVVSSIGWLILFVELKEFARITDTEPITDNLVTTNSDIILKWTRQIAGIDLKYISPTGQEQIMKIKPQYTKPDLDPFVWYKFIDSNTIALSFCSNVGYWSPQFNSTLEYTIYTCRGEESNFTAYDRRNALDVMKGERYAYNADTRMVALCYSGSVGGTNKSTLESLRDDVILAYNTANVLTTDRDLALWYNTNSKQNTKSTFFKRRDDPSGRLFSQFVAIHNGSYIYPTNTLNITVNESQCDVVNRDANGIANEFIIKPGHLWEYDDSDTEITRNRVRMIPDSMISDSEIPMISDSRPFMFTNPFFIKIHRDPTTSSNYNYLVSHTSWPEDVPVVSPSFYQFQLAQFTIDRTLSNTYNDMYHIEVICVPVITSDTDIIYAESLTPKLDADGNEYYTDYIDNNLRLVLVINTDKYGETGYIEMKPTELRNGGAILFETNIAVKDNIGSDMVMEVDLDRTTGMKSLIKSEENYGKVFMDSQEASFHILCMIKDESVNSLEAIFDDPAYERYTLANRFRNDHRLLTLYKSMSMMRSTISFSGENGNYQINASLIPMLRWDIPLDDERMSQFIDAFSTEYKTMEPVLSKLDGNSFLDFKLYNTYGRSREYYIGPTDGNPILRNSNILLDDVYVKVKFRISVYDRTMYTQTVNDVMNEIITTFQSLSNEKSDLHVSDLIHNVIANHPNVRYLRFLGFNNYDANKQSIFIKYPMSELTQEQLKDIVPEIIRVDQSSIEISEEV